MHHEDVQEVIEEALTIDDTGGHEIMHDVLSDLTCAAMRGKDPCAYWRRYILMALVAGGKETVGQITTRLDVMALYSALFLAAEAQMLFSMPVVETEIRQWLFILGFASSLCGFIGTAILATKFHGLSQNLLRESDMIVFIRHSVDLFLFFAFYTYYLGFAGLMLAALPCIEQKYGVVKAAVLLSSVSAFFFCAEALFQWQLLPGKKASKRYVMNWAKGGIDGDPFDVDFLRRLAQVRRDIAKEMTAVTRLP